MNHLVRCVVHGTNQVDPPLTFEDWLKTAELPVGFKPVADGYSFWDQCMPLNWAIHIFKKKGKQ
jgi:hypothetical protein